MAATIARNPFFELIPSGSGFRYRLWRRRSILAVSDEHPNIRKAVQSARRDGPGVPVVKRYGGRWQRVRVVR